jgi:hypothetical protein
MAELDRAREGPLAIRGSGVQFPRWLFRVNTARIGVISSRTTIGRAGGSPRASGAVDSVGSYARSIRG